MIYNEEIEYQKEGYCKCPYGRCHENIFHCPLIRYKHELYIIYERNKKCIKNFMQYDKNMVKNIKDTFHIFPDAYSIFMEISQE